jgi:cysteine-rich repeat protein
MNHRNAKSHMPLGALVTLSALFALDLAGCDGGSTSPWSEESGAVDDTGTGAQTSDSSTDTPIDTTAGRTTSSMALCGVGEEDEQCDDGKANAAMEAAEFCLSTCDGDGMGDVDTCFLLCAGGCGDGVVQGVEQCDDGNADDSDACLSTCVAATCGDGHVQAGVEQCDDGNADDSDACPSTCAAAACGDGVVQAGVEQCDDGNADDSDACLSTCVAAACGDAHVQAAVEQCDDGNAAAGDGCNVKCQTEKVDKVYAMSRDNADGFHGYTISTNTWKTLAAPPTIALGTLTNDGKVVYMLGVDGIVHQYDPGADMWSPSAVPGPNINPGVRAFFKWTRQGFYYIDCGGGQMRHLKNGQWVMLNWGVEGADCGGSWDAARNELYVRTQYEMGFRVLDTTSDTFVRTISDPTAAILFSQMGSYSSGFFYVRSWGGTLKRLDAMTGAKTDTMKKPATTDYNATDTDVLTGDLYLAAYGGTTFQRYRPSDNTLTTLAKTPKTIIATTLTVMRPPLD